MTWGAAQAGVAAGVVDAVRRGIVEEDAATDLLLIAAVWVNPERSATRRCTRTTRRDARRNHRWAAGTPSVRDVLDAGEPTNPYFRGPGTSPAG